MYTENHTKADIFAICSSTYEYVWRWCGNDVPIDLGNIRLSFTAFLGRRRPHSRAHNICVLCRYTYLCFSVVGTHRNYLFGESENK